MMTRERLDQIGKMMRSYMRANPSKPETFENCQAEVQFRLGVLELVMELDKIVEPPPEETQP